MPEVSVFLCRLQGIVGEEHAVGQGETLDRACAAFFGGWQGRAEAIAFPETTEQVRDIVFLCREMGKTIVPQGGNTGLVYGAQPDNDGLVLGFRRMKRISGFDRLNRSVVVGAGVTILELNEFLADHELRFAVSIASEGSSQIGGVVSTNAGGHSVLRYGMTRHQLLGVEAVLADGRIVSGLRGLRKDNAGYDFAQLFCGAEGTLGLITAASLKLLPVARQKTAALLGFASLDSVLEAYAAISAQAAEFMSAFELMSHFGKNLVARHAPDHSFPDMPDAPWYVLLELEASATGVDLQDLLIESLARILENGPILHAVVAQNEDQRRRLWAAREALVFCQGREGPVLSHDLSVRISRIPELIARGTRAVSALHRGLGINPFGHIGDGNVHFNIVHPGPAPDFKRIFGPTVEKSLYEIIGELEGSISAEHGIGKKKRQFIHLCRSADEIGLMSDLKKALDPGGILAPGNLSSQGKTQAE